MRAEYLAPVGLGWLTDPMNADAGLRPGLHPARGDAGPAPAVSGGGRRDRAHRRAGCGGGRPARRAGPDRRAGRGRGQPGVAGRHWSASARRGSGISSAMLARDRGWATPPERRLREGLAQLLAAAPGRQPVLAWGGHEIRRFREHLHLLDVAVPVAEPPAPPVPLARRRAARPGRHPGRTRSRRRGSRRRQGWPPASLPAASRWCSAAAANASARVPTGITGR